MNLSKEEFIECIRLAPLVAIDLVIHNTENEVLIGLRKNKPAKNMWFIPGGVIRKNETLSDAFSRISLNEIGQGLDIKAARLFTVGEHFYKDENAFDIKSIDTHYVVITYSIYIIKDWKNIKLCENEQHFKFKWMSLSELMQREDVHENTKILFK